MFGAKHTAIIVVSTTILSFVFKLISHWFNYNSFRLLNTPNDMAISRRKEPIAAIWSIERAFD